MFDAGSEPGDLAGVEPDPNLTAKIYTHLMRGRFEEGRERLETYMAKKRKGRTPSTMQASNGVR
jgi:hypothetical protein